MRVLVLGADGFLGRHIAFALSDAGYEVVASARRTKALEQMGFPALTADLTDRATHDPTFWRPALSGGTHLVNAAGLLTGPDSAFAAVHVLAPRAAYAALDGGRAVHISAVGIDRADTQFARWRREGESVARVAGAIVLRLGLVLADTSYGGSSLIRALAAMPFRTPVVGDGAQPFNPIHAADLGGIIADCLAQPPGPGPWDLGGPESLTQAEVILAYRRWLGLPPQPLLRLPSRVAMLLGRIGDLVKLGPVSATSVAQLAAGVHAAPKKFPAALGARPRGFTEFLKARPAGTQDLWQARLYLMKPLVRLTLCLVWLVSGLLGLTLPVASFPPLPLPETLQTLAARIGGAADLALAAALLLNWRPRLTGWLQLLLVGAYTLGLTVLAPQLWLAPFGEVLKNLPMLALIGVHIILAEER